LQGHGCKEGGQTTPAEMLQQCSSASSCMQMHIVMEEYNTGCQHSIPFVLNVPVQFFDILQYTSDVVMVSVA
jgi:hypothetical protein